MRVPRRLRALAPLLALCALTLPSFARAEALELPYTQVSQANISMDDASIAAREIAAWIVQTGDNRGLPYIIVDKVGAHAFAFDRHGRLIALAPVLVGAATGDVAPADIGERALSDIHPQMRITPAGRFEATMGVNLAGRDILWLDYDSALSLHAVVAGNVSDRRLHRLGTTTALDNRISYGCINVPPGFYENIVHPLFRFTPGVVYILPEMRSLDDVFFADASR